MRILPFNEVLKVLLDQEADLVLYPWDVGDICGPGTDWHLVVGEPFTLVVAGRTVAL